MGNSANILIGAGNIYFGAKTDGNTGMSDLGYTRDGVTIERGGSFYDVEVDQELSPVLTHLVGERFVVRTNLAEVTLNNMRLAWHFSDAVTASDFSDTVSDASASYQKVGKSVQFGGPDVTQDLDEWSILFRGKAPGTSKVRHIRFHRCISAEFGAVSHTKAGESVIPVSFVCLADGARATNHRVGYIMDETQPIAYED